METNEFWSDCPLVERVAGKHSGDPVFAGSRLPVNAVIQNYADFLEDGLTPDEAVTQTLETYPSTPGGAPAIRAVVEYRAAREPLLQP